jgi:hypothetical protein
VRRGLIDLAVLALLATVALGVALAFLPVRHGVVVDAYVIVLGALAVTAGAAVTRGAGSGDERPEFELALAATVAAPERPAQLERLEREVHLAIANSLYLHSRLRPTLRAIATQRLRTRRGAELDSGSPETRALLGPAWELVRPERPPPRNRDARGLPLAELRAVVEALERI